MSALRYIKKNAMAYLFLLPFVLLFTLFVILPVLIAIVLSLTNYNMLENPAFVGITNFKLLILDDDEFIIALKNTFVLGPGSSIRSSCATSFPWPFMRLPSPAAWP